MPEKKKKKIKSNPFSKFIYGLLLTLVLIGGIGVIGFTLYCSQLAASIPEINTENLTIDLTSHFYDRDGTYISSRYESENREWAEYEELPENFINATIAIEDKKFWEHEGIDPYGIARALVINAQDSDMSQGASTITQQVARNIFIEEDERFQKTGDRKIREIFIALKLEEQMSKEDIFTYYANIVNYGQSAYGLKAAALTYFSKNISDLTLAESALLAGLPQQPGTVNPIDNMEKTIERRNMVLDAMADDGYITAEERDAAKAEEVILSPTFRNDSTTFGWFMDPAYKEAEEILAGLEKPSLMSGGYKVYTTLDSYGQDLLQQMFADPQYFPSDDANGQQAQGAMVVYDQTNGEVRCIAGGRDYTAQAGLNRAFSKDRQPGSTFKPIAAYGPAIEMGLTANDTYVDAAINIGGYKPGNAGGGYSGTVTVRNAIQNSINTVAVQVLNDIGAETGWNFATRLGIQLAEEDKNYLSIAIGGLTVGASPMEMARAFGAFGNQGVLEKPHFIRKIEDSNGIVVYEAAPAGEQVISPTVAYLITDLLQGVVSSGTGTQAKMPINMAGKTGTTEMPGVYNGNKDIWFIGYTPYITGSVWIGFDHADAGNALYNEYGGGYPARLWKAFMTQYIGYENDMPFPTPNPIESIPRTIQKKNIAGPVKTDDDKKKEETDKEIKILEETDDHYVIEVPEGTDPDSITEEDIKNNGNDGGGNNGGGETPTPNPNPTPTP